MFDVSFGEVALLGVIALVVLGPERLPGTARTIGALLRRARTSWESVKAEVEREIATEELKKSLKETADAAHGAADVTATAEDINTAVGEVAKGLDEHPGKS